jgi:hypothetical protein
MQDGYDISCGITIETAFIQNTELALSQLNMASSTTLPNGLLLEVIEAVLS